MTSVVGGSVWITRGRFFTVSGVLAAYIEVSMRGRDLVTTVAARRVEGATEDRNVRWPSLSNVVSWP